MRAIKSICKQTTRSLHRGYWERHHAFIVRVNAGETGLDPWADGGANYYSPPMMSWHLDDIRVEKGYGRNVIDCISELVCDMHGVGYGARDDVETNAWAQMQRWEFAPERTWSDIQRTLARLIELDPAMGGTRSVVRPG